jgi:DNA primase
MTSPRSTSRATQRSERSGRGPAVSVEELHQRLTEAVAALETGEQWQAWLDFARRLHRYSFNNLILIWAQRPDASAVASYQTWQVLHRQVRRGETAIRVLAPILRRTPPVDRNGRPVLSPDGKPEQQQRVIGFRPVPVFDIAQTDGPPPPEAPRPVLLAGQAPDGLWDALAAEVGARGYRLLRGPVDRLHGANGLTKIVQREVWVRDDVENAQAVKTLTHELAHLMLHIDLHTDPHLSTGCDGIREVEAESVAHLVMAAHGVDTAPYSFPYVAAWAYPVAAAEHQALTEIITRAGTRVIQTAHEILDAIPVAAESDPAGAALTARLTHASERELELRERAAASLLPPVERATLLAVVADSYDFYRRQIDSSWVTDYLADRNLTRAIGSHQLGYAPGGWTTLTDHLRSLGYTDEHLQAAGMATRARTGQLIDRIRDRLTIPLRQACGDLVGFTARCAPEVCDARVPKYLNTPTTALFRKHEVLYGLAEHGPRLSSGAVPVVCEGPLDAIAVDLTAADRNREWVGVATVGTAFTGDHAHQLLAATSGGTTCLAFDSDEAGRRATESAWRRLTDHGPVDVRVAVLPDGADPASIAASQPRTLSRSIVDGHPAATVVATRQISEAHLDGHAARELAAFRSLCQLVGRVPTQQRPAFLLDLAQHLHIEPADAAALTAEQNPGIVMDRVISRAQHLQAAVTGSAHSGITEDPQPTDHHLVRTITTS